MWSGGFYPREASRSSRTREVVKPAKAAKNARLILDPRHHLASIARLRIRPDMPVFGRDNSRAMRIARSFSGLFLALALAGCDSRAPAPTSVHGKVFFNGIPLHTGTIIFT